MIPSLRGHLLQIDLTCQALSTSNYCMFVYILMGSRSGCLIGAQAVEAMLTFRFAELVYISSDGHPEVFAVSGGHPEVNCSL
jgi:hypothetical protein